MNGRNAKLLRRAFGDPSKSQKRGFRQLSDHDKHQVRQMIPTTMKEALHYHKLANSKPDETQDV